MSRQGLKLIRRVRPKMTMNQALLLNDNARPHTSLCSKGGKCDNWVECSASSSRFSTFRLPSFCPLKDALRGHRFTDDGELKHNVREDLRCFSSFMRPAYSISRNGEKALIMKTLWKNNLKFVKDVPILIDRHRTFFPRG